MLVDQTVIECSASRYWNILHIMDAVCLDHGISLLSQDYKDLVQIEIPGTHKFDACSDQIELLLTVIRCTSSSLLVVTRNI